MPSDLNSMTPRAHIMSARGKTAQTKQSTEKVANNRMPLYVRELITQSSWKRRAFECKPFNFACNSSFFPLCCCSNDSQTSQTLQTCNVERYIVYWKAVLQQKHTHTHIHENVINSTKKKTCRFSLVIYMRCNITGIDWLRSTQQPGKDSERK